MEWEPFDNGVTLGQTGSEGGLILRDEEHRMGARITLENSGRISPFSITCGVYGLMFHTRFFAERKEADADFDTMQNGIAEILDAFPDPDDPHKDAKRQIIYDMLSRFVDQFP